MCFQRRPACRAVGLPARGDHDQHRALGLGCGACAHQEQICFLQDDERPEKTEIVTRQDSRPPPGRAFPARGCRRDCLSSADGGTDREPAAPLALGRELCEGHDVPAPASGWSSSCLREAHFIPELTRHSSGAAPANPRNPEQLRHEATFPRPRLHTAHPASPGRRSRLGAPSLPPSQARLAPIAAPTWPKRKRVHRLSGAQPGSMRRFSCC